MNINELEKLAKEWVVFDPEANELAPAVLELIAAYRESVAALGGLMFLSDWAAYGSTGAIGDEVPEDFQKARKALATAKRLGVE